MSRCPRLLRAITLVLAVPMLLPGCASSPEPATTRATDTPAHAMARTRRPFEAREVSGLRFEPQLGWIPEPLSAPTRVAEYRLRSVGSDDLDAHLVIHSFGGDGVGSVEENVERWCDQFEQPDGRASREVVVVERRSVRGLEVMVVDIEGTYVAETAPGSGSRLDEPNQRLLAAIVETEAGPYYVRLLGPASAVAAWRASFETFLASLAPAPVQAVADAEMAHP